GKIVPGYRYSFDKNTLTATGTDSVTGSAMYFDEHIFFVESPDTAKTRFRVDYSYRTDLRPTLQGEMGAPEIGQTYNAMLQRRYASDSEISLQATYRTLKLAQGQDEETVQSRIDWNTSFLDGSFRSEMSYSVGTGREL